MLHSWREKYIYFGINIDGRSLANAWLLTVFTIYKQYIWLLFFKKYVIAFQNIVWIFFSTQNIILNAFYSTFAISFLQRKHYLLLKSCFITLSKIFCVHFRSISVSTVKNTQFLSKISLLVFYFRNNTLGTR